MLEIIESLKTCIFTIDVIWTMFLALSQNKLISILLPLSFSVVSILLLSFSAFCLVIFEPYVKPVFAAQVSSLCFHQATKLLPQLNNSVSILR